MKRKPVPRPSPPPPAAAPPPAELIAMDEAIGQLKTTRNTFYRWLRSGRVKGMKVGRQWRFYRADIERFLKGEAPRIALAADTAPLLAALAAQYKAVGAEGRFAAAGANPEEAIVKAVSAMIHLGFLLRASDIHADVFEDTAVLSYRIDGVMREALRYDARLHPAIVERWKTMANCDLHEKRLPQDGRIQVRAEADGQSTVLDLRVCFVPALFGECVTARILDKNAVRFTFDALPYSPTDRERLAAALAAPYGLIICAGPTGSGKTTTLYACLDRLNRPGKRLLSIEDPVEYAFPGVVQIPVNARAGAGGTFAGLLRATLRSDPDVIMVGEMREREALQIVLQAALTGHLVLTTLHAGAACEALRRMVEIGAEPFLVGDATRLIIAQRLVRRLCPHCSRPAKPAPELLAQARTWALAGGLDWDRLARRWHTAKGCEQCRQTGYRGRLAIAETLTVSPDLRRALKEQAPVDALEALAVRHGMTPMAADGVRRAAAAETTLDEIQRVIG
ncbi:MAG: putative type II secretion system protein E [Lentisphaerae bacterium ADurb.BinA184]|nr:MAG: putative type II secretion system protein E [Lentisphaerae bacterium ADurb.BinA184]